MWAKNWSILIHCTKLLYIRLKIIQSFTKISDDVINMHADLWPLSLPLSNHSSRIAEWPSPQPIRRKICRILLSTVTMTAVWKSQRHPAVRALQGRASGPSPYLKTTMSAPPRMAASERWNTPRMVRRNELLLLSFRNISLDLLHLTAFLLLFK